MKNINSALIICAAMASSVSFAEMTSEPERKKIEIQLQKQRHALTEQQKDIALIAANAAVGEMQGLRTALERGLDAGLTLSDCKEVLVQLYAYAGFPRSLNALTELMKLAETRQQQGKQDAVGNDPNPMPSAEAMLAAGTQNQTALVGAPVKGLIFEFAPAIDQYLKSHLFGDIFARDNLSWKNRELATVGALSAMSGVESQLKSHLNVSMNVGFSADQLAELVPFFEAQGQNNTAERLASALLAVRQD
ncbi:carboxymuconolactone decarboxylase family protein [Type-D symbiont of Plautia stali]|uniref:carboxymuconolactone decarboxylase family protein n=1 Tax=Type-D symbiont of Plautia stali TaxID=1560356 RepID=UPI00092EBB55|nr:carboxymuconolactone decarboxylase family protein [Type-D symbiont of Plautia stali]